MFEEVLCRRLSAIGFGSPFLELGFAALGFASLEESEGEQGMLYIGISTGDFGAYLSSTTWDACDISQRLCLHFQLAMTLTHELAHCFSHTVFEGRNPEPLIPGPVVSRLGSPEIGHSWEDYLTSNGGLEGHLDVIGKTEPLGKWGFCLVVYDTLHRRFEDLGEWAKSFRAKQPEYFAVPSSVAERPFQEDWFNEPYPRWNVDLSHVPQAYKCLVWGENDTEKSAREYRQEICKKVADLKDKDQIRLVREHLETMLGVELDKDDYTNWLDPTRDVVSSQVFEQVKERSS
ncbi:MAG: hypothetical protein Q9160_001889 [Pyrenula sp. 1 TL-2023]